MHVQQYVPSCERKCQKQTFAARSCTTPKHEKTPAANNERTTGHVLNNRTERTQQHATLWAKTPEERAKLISRPAQTDQKKQNATPMSWFRGALADRGTLTINKHGGGRQKLPHSSYRGTRKSVDKTGEPLLTGCGQSNSAYKIVRF